MDIRLLKSFILLAENLNFTHTSELLFMTQSTLSRQILKIEEELGVPLFNRDNHGTKLTQFGKIFLEDAKNIISEYDSSFEHINAAKKGCSGMLKIGFIRDSPVDNFIRLITQYRKLYPDVYIKLFDYGQSECVSVLMEKKIDAAFVLGLGDKVPVNFRIETFNVAANKMCLVVPKEHSFAKKKELDLKEAFDSNFVAIDPKVSAIGFQGTIEQCLSNGFIPKIVSFAHVISSLSVMIETGIGIAILPYDLKQTMSDKLVFIPIKNDEKYKSYTVLAWNKDNFNFCLKKFINYCKKKEEKKIV